MTVTKVQIEEALLRNDLESAYDLLLEYEGQYPDDADIISLRQNYCMLKGDVLEALNYALKGVRRLPLCGDMYYNLAYIYEFQGQWLDALLNYQKALVIYDFSDDEKRYSLDIDNKTKELIEIFSDELNKCNDEKVIEEGKKQLQLILQMIKNNFGFFETAFRTYEKVIGEYFYEDEHTKRFVGNFKDINQSIDRNDFDVLHVKGEFIKVVEGNNFNIKINNIDSECEVLLPIASKDSNVIYNFSYGENKYTVEQCFPDHFYYYRMKNGTQVHSDKLSYCGRPIPLCHKKDKKKLVLSVFVDGLSGEILKNENFEKIMPNTYHFFKKGLILKSAYNAAEWTYPSIANYVTGLDTTHHMLFHNKLDCALPLDVPTLAEYFRKDGYYTAFFGGDWRIIPTYGHARGYDRFIWQHQLVGFKVNEVISDAIDHIEAFKETNQYLWISIGDLHDIADGFYLPTEVEKELKLSDRCINEKRGDTSVKQKYDENKIVSYKAQAKRIDRWLKCLYSYIEENYTDDEIVISLFSDHGQGYLIPDGYHFLSKERSNVAMMFRGGGTYDIENDTEIISSLDYSLIMRKLADVLTEEVKTDGILPKTFGGECEREYAYTESIHPNDPYQACIFAKEYTFFFINPYPVQVDGRFELSEYEYWIENKDRERIENDTLSKYFLDIVFKHIASILIYK